MVESVARENLSFPEIGAPLELHHFYEWNAYTEADPSCDEEKAAENRDIVEGELESLASILTELEFQKLDESSALAASAANSLKDVLHVLHLSAVPNFDGKVHAKDKVKNMKLEFRKFPAIELTLVLTRAYPSSQAPLTALRGSFYQKFRPTLMQKLSEIWNPDSPAIYEMVCQMQDEIIPLLIAEYPDDLVADANGDICLSFNNVKELEEASRQAYVAYRRSFDSEEHSCEICMRSLLGEKFTFLSSCEHYFCTECLKDLINDKINSGQIKLLKCAIAGCQKSLNDLDVKNVGLSKEMTEKYEQ